MLVPGRCAATFHGQHAFEIRWQAVDGRDLILRANLGDADSPPFPAAPHPPFAAIGARAAGADRLAPWSVRAYVVRPNGDTP
jgi:1,4-alpha-glucan branching enzyme/maltooligosyltrehalose trehalohydrolase